MDIKLDKEAMLFCRAMMGHNALGIPNKLTIATLRNVLWTVNMVNGTHGQGALSLAMEERARELGQSLSTTILSVSLATQMKARKQMIVGPFLAPLTVNGLCGLLGLFVQ